MDAENAVSLLKAPAENFLAWHPVSAEVNRVANDDAGLILPVEITQSDEPTRTEGEASRKRTRSSRPTSDENQGSLF
jgi:hypothetical protein